MPDQRGNTPDPDDEHQAERAENSAAPEPQPRTLSYASAGMLAQESAGTNFKTFRKLPPFEASLASAKLEAAGIRCFVADQNISVAHPLLFGEVRLQVAEADFARAEQVLAARPAVSDEDDDDEQEGYVEEAYRCPRCRRKAVDLLPLSKPMRNVRLGCLGVLLLPMALSFIAWIIPEAAGLTRGYPSAVVWTWVAVTGVLSFIVLTAKRTKHCRECGHEWGGEPA